jgi:ATP-dependent RNA helicase DOB1
MYNRNTEEKISGIPPIGDIDPNRLPQELTRIYAQIVSLRRQVADGTINSQDESLRLALDFLRQLANNLETILLTFSNHSRKESIAFVAATANSLIYKMGLGNRESDALLEIDTISPYVASVILFLIGNSQADAAEMSFSLYSTASLNLTQQRLISCVIALAKGNLTDIVNTYFNEEEIIAQTDHQEMALNYLWRELGLGIKFIATKLMGNVGEDQRNNHFDSVYDLAVSESNVFNQKNVFAGPYRLAKLLRILEGDIYNRAIIDIPTPSGVDSGLWQLFLEKLAGERPYLWENHKQAINTNFLNPGTSAVLTLPTGAGKSTLAELKIASCLYAGKRAIYLAPTHALEDQINRNLRNLFTEYESERFELDGEYTEFEELDSFPILVMTPERCLTLLNISPDFFHSVGLVVFDEFHLIHGTDIKRDRRSVDAMYCLISLFTLIPQADYLLISAMVENGDEIREWLNQITGRDCLLFNSTWKPTRQLHGCLVFEDADIKKLNRQIGIQRSTRESLKPPLRLKRNMAIAPHCFFSLKNIWETDKDEDYFRAQVLEGTVLLGINERWRLTSNRNDIAAKLGAHFSLLGLKTLIFVDDPRVANATSQKIIGELRNISNTYDEYLKEKDYFINCLKLELGSIEHSYFHGSENVGVHHGLLLPIERNLIEQYFKQTNGAIALVATATLAQGINLPAEIVIIAGDDRFDDDAEGRERVDPHVLLNAAGRAGRAGQSSQGAVILIPGEIVTIEGSTISNRWWQLKNEVFSKGDQCLKIEDPLEYLLDSLQENADQLDDTQINILYRFKSEKLLENDTRKLLSNSFYAHKAFKNGNSENFRAQVKCLLDRKNELDNLSLDIMWIKEISFKIGVDPSIVIELSNAIDQENFDEFASRSIAELIEWFFAWLQSNNTILGMVFTKASAINQIKRAIGLKQDQFYTPQEILEKINILGQVLKGYIQGMTLKELNDLIPNSTRPDKSPYLVKARNFVIRLIPELSYAFGFLAMVIIEKAKQRGLQSKELSWNIRTLASCIREGLDSSEKLFYKKNQGLQMRVETHVAFQNNLK